MRSRLTQFMFAVAAALAASAAQPASISLSPATQGASGATASVDLLIDFTGVRSAGGGLTLAFSGPISFASFSASAFFDTFDLAKVTADCSDLGVPGGDPELCDFTGFGTNMKPTDTQFEIHLGTSNLPSPLTGIQSLGTINVNVDLAGQFPGFIVLATSPDLLFGPFVDAAGSPIAATLSGATINAVPLPATAWLFATGFGLAGFWRRHRA